MKSRERKKRKEKKWGIVGKIVGGVWRNRNRYSAPGPDERSRQMGS
jgi:hypothetical protein